jgi:hypothetical protein
MPTIDYQISMICLWYYESIEEDSMAIQVLDELLDKEMDRREFLAHAGAAALAVIGVAGLLKSLSNMNSKQVSNGYGSGVYGGSANSLDKVKRG